MTREEQINKEAYRQEYLADMDVESFIAGAKWADTHPKSSYMSVENYTFTDGAPIGALVIDK